MDQIYQTTLNNFTQRDGPACSLKGCTHSEKFHGICLLCEADVDASLNLKKNHIEKESSDISYVHNFRGFKIDLEEAKKIEQELQRILMTKKKLSLVLDLDHTLLHATDDQRFIHAYNLKHTLNKPNSGDFHIFRLDGHYHLVKLRPHLDAFLKGVKDKYELHIFTHGSRGYAEQIAKILDPDQNLFHDRIVSREECPDINSKTLKEHFPCHDRTVLIIDDRSDVWQSYIGNLIQIVPYDFFRTYFGVESEVNNAAGKTHASRFMLNKPIHEFENVNERDEQMTVVTNMLKRIHEQFFDLHSAADDELDVKSLLSQDKHKVLKNTHLLFSGLIPLNTSPHEHPIWKKAIEFGATCATEFDADKVTHVVANGPSQKVKLANATPGIYVVHKSWLDDSTSHYMRMNEFDYKLSDKCNKVPFSVNHPAVARSLRSVHDAMNELNQHIRGAHQDMKDLTRDDVDSEESDEEDQSESEEEDHDDQEDQDLADDLMKDMM
ncbi:hypothetical protein AKO1_009971 [Acrasis kona]|uniref:RNA polymerase II subunit A C-terminal domain phosphatase n=1 Tax=Acrasis kona TaxID=1008807 RepID=A0AAW2ZPB8_9EUKA